LIVSEAFPYLCKGVRVRVRVKVMVRKKVKEDKR
jgi:hypothetical protein